MACFLSPLARRGATGLALALIGSPLLAQRRPSLEFTEQAILVSNFWVVRDTVAPSRTRNDLRFGREVGDWVRKRVGQQLNKREAKMVDAYEIRERVFSAGYSPDDPFTLAELRQQAQTFRADEIIHGTVRRLGGDSLRLEAELVVYRDIRMRQPLPAVTASSFDRAVNEFAARVAEARTQLIHQRRCENALRDFQGQRAIQAARQGIRQYPRGALVRTCLVWALRATGAPPDQILAEATAVLNIDPVASHALEAAAVALDSLRRRPEAADMWIRLLATDSTNNELAERVIWAMAENGNSRRAEPIIVRLSDRAPDDMRLMGQKWRIANDNRNWPLAVSAGEKLLAFDTFAAADSIFFLRLASAFRFNGQTYKAVETVARGVAAFPGDSRLYALYTQFVKEETDSVLPRGLALFPNSAELLVLNAKDLRARGQVGDALAASRMAVQLDSTIEQGRLFVAQAEMELGRPDSALVTLRRAVEAGEDRRAVAQFALGKGNALFRAANASERRADFELALRFLLFADTLTPTPQSKFVLGAAALRVAQLALTEAPTLTIKDESCVLARLGHETLPVARASLIAGSDVSAEAVQQFLEYLDEISPYADKQIEAFCSAVPTPAKQISSPR